MTRKHFTIIARAIRSEVDQAIDLPPNRVRHGRMLSLINVTESLAAELAELNDRFDHDRFMSAALGSLAEG